MSEPNDTTSTMMRVRISTQDVLRLLAQHTQRTMIAELDIAVRQRAFEAGLLPEPPKGAHNDRRTVDS